MEIKYILRNIYVIHESVGFTDEEIFFLESRFGKLPAPLREFYSLCGKCPEVLDNQDNYIFIIIRLTAWL